MFPCLEGGADVLHVQLVWGVDSDDVDGSLSKQRSQLRCVVWDIKTGCNLARECGVPCRKRSPP